MNVYVVIAEHSNGSCIMNICKDEDEAEELAESYQEAADEEHDIVEYYVEDHTVR